MPVAVAVRLISTAGRPRSSRAWLSTRTPGVAASTLYRAERSSGPASGFHSSVVACSKTKSSSVSRGWWMTAFLPALASSRRCSAIAWACCSLACLSSRARSAAVSVGIASNWAAVGESCRATGSSLGTPAPRW